MQQFSPITRTIPVDVDALVAQMTPAEKIGQMTQVEKNSLSADDVATYAIGSVLSGGGGNPANNTPSSWASMVRDFQEAALRTRLRIPLIYGSDAVHGHSNLRGAVIFPHNIGMGATRDADLVKRVASTTAREMMASNVHFDFAPAVSVPQDIRWGRIYEGYSQDTAIVTELGAAFVQGLQDGDPRVLASVKHFVADGGTMWGTARTYDWMAGMWQAPGDSYRIDQGDAQISEAELRAIHLPPYISAIKAGAQNIMVSFSSWDGTKMHANRYLINDVLKGELGFDGFVISDWMAINQIDRDYKLCVITSINAGIDMIMVPFDYKTFIATATSAVESGDIPMSRIDDAVRRILRVKAWLGMFDQPFGRADLLPEVGSPAHRAVAREAVRKTLVLLKNEGGALPLPHGAHIHVGGRGADDLGMQCGGWSIEWQGGTGATTIGTTVLQAIRSAAGANADLDYAADGKFDHRAAYGVVVVGELPYAEGLGDNGSPVLSDEDLAVIERMRATSDHLIVVLLTGRPLILTDVVPSVDALVVAWLPGTEGDGVADVLFGAFPFSGKLPHDFPRSIEQVPLRALKAHAEAPLFPFGFGL